MWWYEPNVNAHIDGAGTDPPRTARPARYDEQSRRGIDETAVPPGASAPRTAGQPDAGGRRRGDRGRHIGAGTGERRRPDTADGLGRLEHVRLQHQRSADT